MDAGDAIQIDMEEIVGGDILHPMAYSNDTEKEQENAEIVGLIKTEVNKASLRTSDCSIYRVPAALFKENPDAYIPRMVSIGPFHHDKEHLQPTQAFKMQRFKEFLNRSSPPLGNYVKAVTDLVERAYQCYSELKIERKSFIMIMLVDGCFILELLLKLKNGEISTFTEYEWGSLFFDMVLLENQLPLFVLEELYQIFTGDSDEAADAWTIKDLFCRTLIPAFEGFLFGKVKNNSFRQIDQIPSEPKHFLDLFRQLFIPSSSPIPLELSEKPINDEMKKQKPMVRATKSLLAYASRCILPRWCVEEEDNSALEYFVFQEPMRCATELKNANVKFQSNKNPTSLCDIKFDNASGVLKIPPIMIQDITEHILRNLIAFEAYSTDYCYITEYISFIASLINSTKDVEFLLESGIFDTIIDVDPSDVVKLFKSLPKNVSVRDEFTAPISHEVMNYYNRAWHKWKASLMLNYFNTPWAFISVVAAMILLILTITQTTYAALSYHY